MNTLVEANLSCGDHVVGYSLELYTSAYCCANLTRILKTMYSRAPIWACYLMQIYGAADGDDDGGDDVDPKFAEDKL